jgi:hypothetical protein
MTELAEKGRRQAAALKARLRQAGAYKGDAIQRNFKGCRAEDRGATFKP